MGRQNAVPALCRLLRCVKHLRSGLHMLAPYSSCCFVQNDLSRISRAGRHGLAPRAICAQHRAPNISASSSTSFSASDRAAGPCRIVFVEFFARSLHFPGPVRAVLEGDLDSLPVSYCHCFAPGVALCTFARDADLILGTDLILDTLLSYRQVHSLIFPATYTHNRATVSVSPAPEFCQVSSMCEC